VRPPIVADNKGDVLVFDSVDKAERYLEPIDIRNGEYVIYDRDGRRINGTVIEDGSVERVKLEPMSEPGNGRGELYRVLTEFLKRVSGAGDTDIEPRSLDELIEMAIRFKTE
jgi:hypothetical protein